jgi:two-component system NtrC family sensor kinase
MKFRYTPRLRFVERLSLRGRLIAAFVALIVSSATCTIFIGSLVFGQKVVELATSKMEVGLKVAETSLDAHLTRLRLLATVEAERLREGGSPRVSGGLPAAETVLDVALLLSEGGGTGARRDAGADERTFPVDIARPGGAALAELAAYVRVQGKAVSSVLALDRATAELLGYASPADGLFLAAGAPVPGGDGVVILFALLNGHPELFATPIDALWPGHRDWYAATVFLGDKRVATTMGPEWLESRADPLVTRRVLDEGRLFLGSAAVVRIPYYTAYMPLRDYRGRAIGMLGVGVREEVYTDMQGQTVTLFSGLIALGMIFGFAMTYVVSAWLIKPVRELAQGMNRVAEGDLALKVRIHSTDELGRLANAFNLMVKAIKERDMRLREQAEERLSLVEKQVSIGRLAAGVAHEINNPLTSILSLSMLLQKGLPADDPRHEDLDVIVAETTRCREIVKNLLDFARERPSAKTMVDLNQVIRETLVLTRKYEGMDKVTVETHLSAEPQWVNADPKQLQQVFTNLVTNAAEAMETRGTITLSTDEDSSGGFVVAEVRDTGKGMPKEVVSRAFEPFFTTKGARKGTGLGLSVTLGIVRKHDGTIDIDSTEGVGTLVRVTLPRASGPGLTP